MSKQFILAYCVENSNIAKEIERNLSQANYTFEHIKCEEGDTSMGDVLAAKSEEIILLISDNFLRSVSCMKDSLSWFQNLSSDSRLLPVVVDGRKMENGSWKTVPTSFEKVSNVIKYMNFWQEEYLELRKNKRIEGVDDLKYNEYLKDVRTISSEVGEFLRHVRSSNHFSFKDFSRNNYKELFHWNDDMSLHKKFSDESRKNTPIKETVVEEVEAIEIPAAPIIVAPAVPIIAAVVAPVIDSNQGISNPVEMAKPEPIQMPSTEEVAGNIVEELFEEDSEEIIIDTELNEADEERLFEELFEEDLEEIVIDSEFEVDASTDDEEVIMIEELQSVEDIEENPLDILVEEIVAEEKENQADEGVTLEDLDEEMFGSDEEEEEEEEEVVSTEIISVKNLFAADKKIESDTEEVLDVPEKRDVIENILTDSRESLEKGNVPNALNMLKGGIDQYPEEINLRYYYAYVLANAANKTEAAKKQLNIVLKQSPSHADANYLAGEIAELEESYVIAKNHYSRVVVVDNDYQNAHYRLACILAKRFRGKEELAVTHFKEAVKQDKSNADALFQIACLHELKLNNYEKAAKYYHKTLEFDLKNADVYLGLARLSRIEEDAEAALDYYKKAVEINSNLATQTNQRLFAPSYVIQKAVPREDVLSAKDLRLKELESDIERLQKKLSEMEQESDKQRNDQQQISTSIHKASGNTVSTFGTETEQLSVSKAGLGKVVFITGATSGIGKATSELFARNGYRIIITGRREERLEDLKNKYITDYQADVKILSYDVRNPVSVKEAIQSLEGDWRNVDILINNAGLAKGFSPIQEGDMRHWEQMIDTNIKGLLYMTRAIAPHMVERKNGHIINVCSTAGHEVYPNGNVYCATKHAVDALTKSMRIDLHKHNVRVSQVSPGHVEETEFALVRFDGDEDRAKIYDDFRPLTSSDVADAIYYMASRPAHVNIQDILLMGTQQASSNHVDRSGR